eukprot:3932364-Rhodomonas_salina.2
MAEGLDCRVQGVGPMLQGLVSSVLCLGSRAWGLASRGQTPTVQGPGSRLWGLGSRARSKVWGLELGAVALVVGSRFRA